MRQIDLGGFTIARSTNVVMLVVFVVYTILIVGLGFFVKASSKTKSGSKMASFLTGEGGLSTIELAFVAATTALAGGTMLGAPSLASKAGYIYVLVVTTLFLATFITFASVGKKIAIMRQRTGAQTIVQLLRHRFQSTGLAAILLITGIAFLVVAAGAQLSTAAKLFAALFGGRYTIGLFISAAAMFLYTASGGIKSLARVSVLQGIVMVIAVIVIAVFEYRTVAAQYGSLEAAMHMAAVSENLSGLVKASSWTPLYAFGTALCASWGTSGMPAQLQTGMFYNSTKVMKKAALQSTLIMIFCHFCMSGGGPLITLINPNLTVKDYGIIYIASTFLPSWMAGIVVSGIFAAIQSSVAAYMIMIGGYFCNDFYKGIINPKATDDSLSKINIGVIAAATVIAMLVAAKPVEFVALLTNMSAGGQATIFFITTLAALYWKKCTAAGAIACSGGGFLVYVICYLLQTRNAEWYSAALGNAHPMIFSFIANIVLIVVVSLLSQNRKVCLGTWQVWFAKDYDEKFAKAIDVKPVN